jgi:uncharacterized protein YjbI with pentapeptide repeats
MRKISKYTVPVFLLGNIIAGVFMLINGDKTASLINNNVSHSADAKSLLVGKREVFSKAVFKVVEAQSTLESTSSTSRQQDDDKLPGVFRGDWGETPVYQTNDRVNYEGAAYLSLLDANQHQTPTLSNAFWRKVKEAQTIDILACMAPAPNVELKGCDYSVGEGLRDLDLRGANLAEVKLTGFLGNADLSGANLSGASVIGTLVIGPDTRIDNANLSGLQSDGNNPLVAEGANLNNSNLSGANLYGSKMKGVNLENTNLAEAILTSADLALASLRGANLSKTDLTYANLTAGVFVSATFRGANLSSANLTKGDFTQANLQQVNFAGANIEAANFSNSDLRGANLIGVQGADSSLVDNQTNFMYAICPDGMTVDGAQVSTCVGHGF